MWLLFYLVFFGALHVSVLLLGVVLLPIVFFTLGVSWLLASLGVFLRDVTQITSLATSILMFLSPVFYPVSALPAEYQTLLLLNPLTPAIEMTRDVLVWGKQPDWSFLLLYMIVTAAICCLGFAWFQRTRKGFADVL